MSKKIPFLEMFAALTQWAEFVNAMEGWVITEASIDRSSRSAVVTVARRCRAQPGRPGGGDSGPVLWTKLCKAELHYR